VRIICIRFCHCPRPRTSFLVPSHFEGSYIFECFGLPFLMCALPPVHFPVSSCNGPPIHSGRRPISLSKLGHLGLPVGFWPPTLSPATGGVFFRVSMIPRCFLFSLCPLYSLVPRFPIPPRRNSGYPFTPGWFVAECPRRFLMKALICSIDSDFRCLSKPAIERRMVQRALPTV